ncbi:YpoC family protein [Ureibacillus manganicus]|uniref:YpoC family protein n=1 Tax=Ureibacillus manganicus TaxID=1266064 RepID=UPI000AFDA686
MITFDPVKIQKNAVEPMFLEWEELSKLIHEAHQQRNRQAKVFMEKGIELYERLIVTTSNQESEGINVNEDYEVLPLNGMERLSFIKARPGQFACYRQLDELFKETKKRLARLRVKMK